MRDQLRRWTSDRNIMVPLAIVGLIAGSALIGPLFLGDPDAIDLRNSAVGVLSPDHLLGTDRFGRDILTRVLAGARVSLLVGLLAVVSCTIIGGGLGLWAGFRQGRTDTIIMRSMDMILAFPALVLALTVAAFLGPGLKNVVFAVAFAQIPHYARLARATALRVREQNYVLSSGLMGGSPGHVLVNHVMPQVIGSLMVYALLAMGVAILVEAALSFLGLGVRPPTPSWGGMIAEGRAELQSSPHMVLVPGAFLFLTILSLNMLGDAVRARARRTSNA